MNSLDFIQVFLVFCIIFLSLVFGYSLGHKDGMREGYTRGRDLARKVGVVE